MKYLLNLHLFDGEGAEASGNEAAVTQQQGEVKTDATPSIEKPEDRQKAYDDFKKNNKDLFSQDFQKQFDKRFKDHKELQSKVKSQDEVINRLFDKYHVDNIEALNSAMDSDDSLFLDAADEAGMSVEQFKHMKALERENKELLEKTRKIEADEKANEQVNAWRAEGEELKILYPDFSIENELSNPLFSKMLTSGFSVKDAYRAAHFDDLMNNAVGSTAAKVEKAVVDNIKAKGSRPSENGFAQSGAITSKKNVSEMSSKEILEIAERVKRGEKIDF